MAGADEDALGRFHPLFRVGKEAGVGLDRVLKRGAVDLGREGGDIGAGEDRRAHHQVVGQGQIDAARPLGHRACRGHVGLDVAGQLLTAQLGEGLDLEALIRVLDVDGQEAADLGIVDLNPLDPRLAVLAEQVDLVPKPGQCARQVGVVDVAAGATQHVAVKDEKTHRDRASY